MIQRTQGVGSKVYRTGAQLLPKQTVEYLQSMKKIMMKELKKPMAATGRGNF